MAAVFCADLCARTKHSLHGDTVIVAEHFNIINSWVFILYAVSLPLMFAIVRILGLDWLYHNADHFADTTK